MSSGLFHEDIPPKRQQAILRKKQAEAAAAAAEAEAEAARNKQNLDDTIATPPHDHQANFRVAGGSGAGNASHSGAHIVEENPVLNLCIKRIGKLEAQMEELVETNKKLGDLLSKVADRVGVSLD